MNEQSCLFQSLPENSRARSEVATLADALRVLTAQRNQIALRPVDLEATVGPDHPVRNVWAFVERLDLSALYAQIGSVEGAAGRPAIDPKILMALWLYATLDGVGSAMPPVFVTTMLSLPTTAPVKSTASRLIVFGPEATGMATCHAVLEVHVAASGTLEPARRMWWTFTQPLPASVTGLKGVEKFAPPFVVMAKGTEGVSL